MPRHSALLLAVAAALALALAPARAADLPIGAIAATYNIALGPGCGPVLYPPSAELEAAATACWGAIDAAADAPPTACPSDECRAFAKGMGKRCWFDFHLTTNALRAALATALEGGKALPSAEVAKMQNVTDFLAAKDPAANPRADLAAALKAGNATAAAALRKEASYAATLEVACRPDLLPAPPAAPAPAATAAAGDAPTYVEALAAIYKDEVPACKDVLFPSSAEFKAAQSTCAGGAWWEIPTECPTKGAASGACLASAQLWGADCHAEFEGNLANNVLFPASTALAGGQAMPAADVAKLQAWRDLLTRTSPSAFPPLDWAAALESGDIAYAAVMDQHAKMFEAMATVCAAAARASPAPAPAAAAAGGAAAAAAEVASGARAPAAAAAAVLLAALLV
jgi:hypothetical protein